MGLIVDHSIAFSHGGTLVASVGIDRRPNGERIFRNRITRPLSNDVSLDQVHKYVMEL
jgi:hypothetical protein